MKFFNFELTLNCNLHCSYCDALTNTRKNLVSEKDRLKNFRNVLKNVGNDDIIMLCGGEPTLFRYFYEFLEECHKTKSQIILFTNGLSRLREDINQISYINVSIHLNQEKYIDKIIKNLYNYNNTIIFKILTHSFDSYNLGYLKNLVSFIKNRKNTYIFPTIIYDPNDYVNSRQDLVEYVKFNDYFKRNNIVNFYDLRFNSEKCLKRYFDRFHICKKSFVVDENGNIRNECDLSDKICKDRCCSFEEFLMKRFF